MAVPTLTPASTTSTVILPVTGTIEKAQASGSYPFAIYADETSDRYSEYFISGALDQVSYTYKKLGGDVLDVELTEENIYAAYEEAVLEYSYILNIHQAKNTLPSALGNTTGTFDHDGKNLTGPLSASLKFPKFKLVYTRRVGNTIASEVGVGGDLTEYSASFDTSDDVQDYDLQSLIAASSSAGGVDFAGKVGSKKVTIKRVFYRTPHSMWRFYGYYGGLSTVGNLSTYGMYADDSTFEVIPPWQNKMQAMAYEDAIYTRNSHYSYELKNNKLRLYPTPHDLSPGKMWVQFTIEDDVWDESASDSTTGVEGVNNMNTLPFGNIPYININSIGKQWIRRFCLALTKEMLGQVRGKFASIPIPGDSVNLNATDLLSQAKEEQEKLREELKTVLDELTYSKITETNASIVKSASEITQQVPAGIFVG